MEPFLFGAWLKTAEQFGPVSDASGESCIASYVDQWGAAHRRAVTLGTERLVVADEVSGFNNNGVLRWRLKPGQWSVDGNTVRCGDHTLTVTADIPVERFALVEGWESRYYMKKSPVPVLEVELDRAAFITSEYRWCQ